MLVGSSKANENFKPALDELILSNISVYKSIHLSPPSCLLVFQIPLWPIATNIPSHLAWQLLPLVLHWFFWAALEFFKPVGKRTAMNGTKPRLPPGPRGVPLLGSLGDLLHPTRSQVCHYFSLMRFEIQET